MFVNLAATFFLATLATARPFATDQAPAIVAESLSGNQVSLPAASMGLVTILCIGFSHASQSQLRPWADRLNTKYRGDAHVSVYSIAVLEDAPRLVRGMAVHGIKSGVPAAQRDHFLMVYRGESDLKALVKFDRPENAFVVLLDPGGGVQWRHSGPLTEDAFDQLIARASSILSLH
jgi:hypothetical protein